jgi:hypothetical protein
MNVKKIFISTVLLAAFIPSVFGVEDISDTKRTTQDNKRDIVNIPSITVRFTSETDCNNFLSTHKHKEFFNCFINKINETQLNFCLGRSMTNFLLNTGGFLLIIPIPSTQIVMMIYQCLTIIHV